MLRRIPQNMFRVSTGSRGGIADDCRTGVGDVTPRKANVAYDRLKELLVTLEIEPGALIDESVLIHRLSVGSTPLREAVKRPSHEGLIVHLPRRGSWVSSLSVTDLRHTAETRRILEPAAACLAAERITSAQVDRIQNELDRSDAMAVAGGLYWL